MTGGWGVVDGRRRGFEGQDGFMVQHEIRGLRPKATKSDTLRGLESWLLVTSVMLNALCMDQTRSKGLSPESTINHSFTERFLSTCCGIDR